MIRHNDLRWSLRSRIAFTLVELLVVIAIIAILAALGTMAVMKVMGKGPDALDVGDIKELEKAIVNFKTQYKAYPPSLVKLCHYMDDYDLSNPLDAESVAILQKIWPSIFKFARSATAGAPNNTPIPWAGTGPAPGFAVIPLPVHPITGKRCVVLQGHHCLVFFLGGPRGVQGFSESANFPIQNPNDTTFFKNQKSHRVTFYEFKPDRLQERATFTPTNASMPFVPANMPVSPPDFPAFTDNNDKIPFVYFVGGNKWGYNYPFPHKITELGDVQPYHEAFDAKGRPTRYLNPETFQIIGAGVDRKFGPIGPWSDGISPVAGNEYKDNRANFHPRQLGPGAS